MYFESDKPLSVIAESVDNLFESRQTEMAAINFFKNSGVDKEGAIKFIERFRIADQTKNKVLTLPMAISYVRSGNLAHVLNTFKKISELINANKIPIHDRSFYQCADRLFRSAGDTNDRVSAIRHGSQFESEHSDRIDFHRGIDYQKLPAETIV